jgi:hypothetical protein
VAATSRSCHDALAARTRKRGKTAVGSCRPSSNSGLMSAIFLIKSCPRLEDVSA